MRKSTLYAGLLALVMACGPDKAEEGIVPSVDTTVQTPDVVDVLPDDVTLDVNRAGYPLAHGYPHGTVLIYGGGEGGSAQFRTEVFRAENPAPDFDAPVVIIPTALPDPPYCEVFPYTDICATSTETIRSILTYQGFRQVIVLHTRTPTIADTEEFIAPVKTAYGVYFEGGRQWRLADAYLGTRFLDEVRAVLDRGGVVGGTSAGASIMGSFLVRGDTENNRIVIGDHILGFGFLSDVGIDQHVAQRHRERDLFQVVNQYPDILGIGLDASTGGALRGNVMEVVGSGSAYINYQDLAKDGNYLVLSPGERYDISTLTQF